MHWQYSFISATGTQHNLGVQTDVTASTRRQHHCCYLTSATLISTCLIPKTTKQQAVGSCISPLFCKKETVHKISILQQKQEGSTGLRITDALRNRVSSTFLAIREDGVIVCLHITRDHQLNGLIYETHFNSKWQVSSSCTC